MAIAREQNDARIKMIITSEKELRQISEKVDLTEGRKIALELEQELRKSHNGIGLAAPQIGIFKRVVVVRAPDYIHFVNPKIIEKRNPFIHKNEGCLSFPGVWINTLRYRDVVVEDDLHGTTEFHQLGALVAQHECLPHESIISTEDGDKTIKEIFEKKWKGKVLSWNNNLFNFEYRKIIGWSKNRNKNKKKWVRLKFSRTGPNKSLICTEDHRCFCVRDILNPEQGLDESDAIDMENKYLARLPTKRKTNKEHALYNSQQLSAIYGSLLGDMCISSKGELISNHGEPQREYSEFKANYFGGIVKKGYSGFRKEYSNICFHGPITEQTKLLREKIYAPSKQIDFLAEKMTPISLAFWYMDDGSLNTRGGFVIHTEGFDKKQNEVLKDAIFKLFNIKCQVSERKVRNNICYFLKFKKKEESKFFQIISKYVHPSMRYKLRDDIYEKFEKKHFDYKKIPFSCKKITEIKHLTNKESCLFNLEIEGNHNFIANNSLVHNCDHLNGVLFFDRAIPEAYDPCICNSGKKFKFCCYKNLK